MIIEAVTRDFNDLTIGNVSQLPEVDSGNQLVIHHGHLKSLPHMPIDEGDEWVYNTDAEVHLYMADNQEMGQRAIFDTWARTDGGTFYATGETPGGQAANWRFDESEQIFRCTVNSTRPLSILSITRHEDFELAATLASTATDNDTIGLVIAAEVINDQPYLLVAYRTGGHLHSGNMFAIGYLEPGQTNPVIITSVNTGESSANWSVAGRTTRVEITRTGDDILVRATRFGSSDYLPDLTLDLNSDSRLHKFKGAMRYGFYTYSQSDSQYRDVNQPHYGARAVSLESSHAWEFIDGQWVDLGPVNIKNYIGFPKSVINPNTGEQYYIHEDM